MSLLPAIPNLFKIGLWPRLLSAVVGRHSPSGANVIPGSSIRNRCTMTEGLQPMSRPTSSLDVAFPSPSSSTTIESTSTATTTRSYTLYRMHELGPPQPRRVKQRPLDGNPFMKGIVLKTLIKNPKKPNSGNRKCVLLRLSNGSEELAHVPGVGHSLQEHNIVLVKCRRLKDTPGVWLKVIRGKYDCGHVIRKPHYTKK